jgi:hypothetical protein
VILVVAMAAGMRAGCGAETTPAVAPGQSALEARFLASPALVTDGMTKAGEGYFSPDGSRICYQAVPPGRQFYEIFVQDFAP